MYHYYWSDPCPIMGSGLLDYYRRPYQVYDTFKSVYGRVLISLERDAKPYIIGRPKVYNRGSTLVGRIWVTNDFSEPIEETQVSWRITRADTGDVMSKNDLTWTLAADGSQVVDEVAWAIPPAAEPGDHRVGMKVSAPDGTVLSTNHTDIVVR
jgi:beta-mannosidase